MNVAKDVRPIVAGYHAAGFRLERARRSQNIKVYSPATDGLVAVFGSYSDPRNVRNAMALMRRLTGGRS